MAVVRRRQGKEPDKPPPLPALGLHLWNTFCDLAAARQCHMTPQPIPYSEIVAYQQATGLPLSGWEVAIVRHLDDRFLKAIAEKPST